MANNVLSEDEAYKKDIEMLGSVGPKAEELVKEYISLLKEIKENKIIEGSSADNIADFAEVLNENLTGKYIESTKNQISAINKFLSDVDEADKGNL